MEKLTSTPVENGTSINDSFRKIKKYQNFSRKNNAKKTYSRS